MKINPSEISNDDLIELLRTRKGYRLDFFDSSFADLNYWHMFDCSLENGVKITKIDPLDVLEEYIKLRSN